MRLEGAFKASVWLVAALLVLGGCKDTRDGGSSSPKRSERPEYDCRKHSKDKICEVPWKDKTVLYCYKGKIPKVVRYREEC